MACSSEKEHFGRTHCLHLQDFRASKARHHQNAGSKQGLMDKMGLATLTLSLQCPYISLFSQF
jgi:hypothetical protein